MNLVVLQPAAGRALPIAAVLLVEPLRGGDGGASPVPAAAGLPGPLVNITDAAAPASAAGRDDAVAARRWIARSAIRPWNAVATSADGARLVAVERGGRIFTSAPDERAHLNQG